jgi:hypothetical protein
MAFSLPHVFSFPPVFSLFSHKQDFPSKLSINIKKNIKVLNVFQIFDRKNEVPEIVKKNIMSLNENINYQLFDFEDGKKFINDNFEPNIANRLVERINNLRRFAHKSDLLRYCLLYKLGGVYIDIDLKPLVPFRDIIKDYNFVSQLPCQKRINPENDYPYKHIVNGFIYSEKNNGFLFNEIKFLMKMGSYSKHYIPCNHFYQNMSAYCNMIPYSEIKIGDKIFYFNVEIKKNDEKYQIVDKDNNILINSNGHDYPKGIIYKKYAFD